MYNSNNVQLLGESTLGSTKNGHYKVHFGSFSNVFLNVKKWTKPQKPWNNVKVDIFSMSKLMVLYPTFNLFEHLYLLLNMKNILLDMWQTLNFFLLLLHTIRNNKVHHMYFIFFKLFIPKCHNPWDYNMSQNCGKICNSIKNNESITFFLMDRDPKMVSIAKSIFHWKLMFLV
jgi:hypothetical protein